MNAVPALPMSALPLDSATLPEPLRTREFLAEAEAIFGRYPRRINALLPILQLAASVIPLAPTHVAALARHCWATPEQGLLVARAYRLLAQAAGVPRVTVCVNLHCAQAGGEALRDACRTMLRGQPVIVDDLICFGHCTEGPCAEVNGTLITEATPGRVLAALGPPGGSADGNGTLLEGEDR
jgi:NADH:ubiquinone oxidoreductase subunit E